MTLRQYRAHEQALSRPTTLDQQQKIIVMGYFIKIYVLFQLPRIY